MHHINPAGTDGFAFLEFTTKEPLKLDTQFKALGFTSIAKHITYDITLYQQNDIYFIINLHQNTLIKQFTTARSSGTTAMGFKVKDAKLAYQHAIAQGALPYEPHIDELTYDIPAIYGVGNTLIYFVDLQNNQPNYLAHFVPMTSSQPKPSGSHLTYLDHVTHNLHRGNMDSLANFYERVFNFREIRYFDIEGKLTGLKSRAMTSPCGKIRIPLNESSDDKSQIEEFLKDFNGEGIQHIALGTDNIYNSVEILRDNTIQFLDTPDTYYELIQKRLPAHGEPLELLKKLRILIDGNTHTKKEILLQIFTKNMLGPVFFEIIQRKGDEGFGEGNFKALFESIELDQINRGVLEPTENR